MSELRGSDRVSIETDVHQLYRDLTERSTRNPETAPFLLMKDVFMWAVALGVHFDQRQELVGSKTQIFRWDQFSESIDLPSLKAIAVAATGDVDVLVHEDEILRIAEEYANAGVRLLKREVLDKHGQPLWNLLSVIRQPAG